MMPNVKAYVLVAKEVGVSSDFRCTPTIKYQESRSQCRLLDQFGLNYQSQHLDQH